MIYASVHMAPSTKASQPIMGTQNMVCPHDGVLLSHEKEKPFDTCYAKMNPKAPKPLCQVTTARPTSHTDVPIKETC